MNLSSDFRISGFRSKLFNYRHTKYGYSKCHLNLMKSLHSQQSTP